MNRDERLKVRRQKQNARADERQKVIDEVLEIIDKHGQQLISDIIDCKFQEIIAADVLASVREDVLALKGEQE